MLCRQVNTVIHRNELHEPNHAMHVSQRCQSELTLQSTMAQLGESDTTLFSDTGYWWKALMMSLLIVGCNDQCAQTHVWIWDPRKLSMFVVIHIARGIIYEGAITHFWWRFFDHALDLTWQKLKTKIPMKFRRQNPAGLRPGAGKITSYYGIKNIRFPFACLKHKR